VGRLLRSSSRPFSLSTPVPLLVKPGPLTRCRRGVPRRSMVAWRLSKLPAYRLTGVGGGPTAGCWGDGIGWYGTYREVCG
jgi:hypothetical protein